MSPNAPVRLEIWQGKNFDKILSKYRFVECDAIADEIESIVKGQEKSASPAGDPYLRLGAKAEKFRSLVMFLRGSV